MRIALLQSAYRRPSKDGQLARLRNAARVAAGNGAALLVTSEMFLTGYNIGAATARQLAEPSDGPAAAAISDIARSCAIAIACGYPELGDDGAV